MQEHKVELLPLAWVELEEIADIHLELVGAKSAQKITDKILDSLDLLAINPHMGVVPKQRELAEQGFRVLICGNYLCFYKIGIGIIEVYHIVDGRRDYPKLII